jgi:hypothetical protein
MGGMIYPLVASIRWQSAMMPLNLKLKAQMLACPIIITTRSSKEIT